jgi:hypothetical protein
VRIASLERAAAKRLPGWGYRWGGIASHPSDLVETGPAPALGGSQAASGAQGCPERLDGAGGCWRVSKGNGAIPNGIRVACVAATVRWEGPLGANAIFSSPCRAAVPWPSPAPRHCLGSQ